MVSRRSVIIFLIAIGFLGVADGLYQTSFNNYLDSTFHITAEQRGDLELPREFPGFMVAIMAGALFFMGDVNLAVFSSALAAVGILGMGLIAHRQDQYLNMIVCSFAWSAGTHLLMPTSQALTLSLSEEGRTGALFGRQAGVRAIATVLGCVLVIVNFRIWPQGYSNAFVLAAAASVLAAVAFLVLRPTMPAVHHSERRRMVLKKRYGLFYALAILFGARKQVFITFAPWVLISVFHEKPETIAVLWIVATGLTVFVLPWVGRMVDRVGPRRILTVDAVLLFTVCITYGFARDVLPAHLAIYAVYGAFVMDQMLFPVQMARTVYLSQIAEHRRDVTPTLSLSVSVDHAVSIPIAMLGGRLWLAAGYRWVFAAAGVVALILLTTVQFIRVGPPHRDLTAGEAPA